MAARLRTAFPAVEVREAAASDVSGQTEFVVVLAEPGYSGMRERSYPDPSWETERITVQVERVDDVVAADRSVDFMKVDVEGAELQVFRGAFETLKRNRPVIAFEHGPGAAERYGTTPEDVWELLADGLDLRIYDMDAHAPLARAQFVELFASGSRWNYVARP
jgi:FkbM family methyltransferase